jgi:hypothetical protein
VLKLVSAQQDLAIVTIPTIEAGMHLQVPDRVKIKRFTISCKWDMGLITLDEVPGPARELLEHDGRPSL